MKIPVDNISPNPQQPRTRFDQEYIKGLAKSIKKHGLNNPILVEDNGGGKYTLVDGECRLRAHKLAGLKMIEAIVRPETNHKGKQRLIDAMITFVRQDMNVVDEALGYLAMREQKLSVKEISMTLGRNETHIYSRLAITDLEPEIQEFIAEGSLPHTPDAVNALLSVKNSKTRVSIAKKLADRNASTKIIVKTCAKFLDVKKQIQQARMKMPALELARMTEKPPEWDALFQLGKVPPWQQFTESVMWTCDNCALRPEASEKICGPCPVVYLCRKLMEKKK